ncbi:MAG TPA: hypothetical protein VHX44_05515, partial [Planctomycetota bacterium]|nr:hypothetical protein [Planctomycetota bacterium]
RVVFVTLAILVGLTSGSVIYRGALGDTLPVWFGGAMGFGIAITLVACEHAFRRRFTRSLVAFIVGLGAGLTLSWILLSVLRLVIQDENVINNLDLPLALVTTYLVLVLVLRNADHFRVVVPFVEFRAERADSGAVVLDAGALGDGRTVALVRSGLLPRRLLVHRQVLLSCETSAASSDPAVAARGRRALDGLNDLRALPGTQVEIDDTEVPNATTLTDLLVHLTRLENGRLLAVDKEVLAHGTAEAVTLIDLAALAGALSPTLRPGEQISVVIEKTGEAKHQGVGHLDDGSLVVVGNAADAIGTRVDCTIVRLHATSNGRMVFADRITTAKA